jgi:replicative DNA helicase
MSKQTISKSEKNRKEKEQQDLSVFAFGKTTPQARDLEEAVLGAIMLESYVAENIIAELSEDLFYSDANKKICKAILELSRLNKPIDILTVTNQLKQDGTLDICGGAYYIVELTNRVATAANVEFHLRILQQEALRRKLISVCTMAVKMSYDSTEDVFDVHAKTLTDLESSVAELLKYHSEDVGSIHKKILEQSERILEKGISSGVQSGLRMLDNVTNGWQKSDLIIVAGRPGMGKTAIAVSVVMHPSIYRKKPTAFFSLEMSKEQLVSRMQSNLSKVDVSRIVKKQMSKMEIDKVRDDCHPLEDAPIYIDDSPNISMIDLKSKSRKLVRDMGVELIVIDYLQLMRSGLNIQNREQEIAEISRGLKGLAKELKIPIIALSQLSRTVESRSDKKPMLSDLRESGQIEQDADMVIFCYRPEYYAIETYEVGGEQFASEGLFMCIVAKHRNGELGEIPLRFIGNQTKVTNYQQEEEVNYTNLTRISSISDDMPF